MNVSLVFIQIFCSVFYVVSHEQGRDNLKISISLKDLKQNIVPPKYGASFRWIVFYSFY
jgi:hypothetical protein